MRIVLAIIGLLIVVGGLGGIKAAQIFAMIEAGESFKPPPESVSSAPVESVVWEPRLSAVGTVVATQAVTVSTEVPGTVARLRFDSGETVKAGQVLVELDTSLERAQLASASASAELGEINLRRIRNLVDKKVNTQAELDQAVAESKRTKAQVDQIRAQIGKKTIRAPFSGRLGIRQIDLGEILSAGQPIVSLQNVDRVFVDFFLPQQQVSRIETGQTVSLTSDASPGTTWKGTLDAIEPAVEVATRNLKVRALVDNADHELWPGMFVEVQVELPSGPPQLVVPETAILYAPYGNTAFVIEDSPDGPPDVKIARQVLVELGTRKGDFITVTSGLEEGQRVVKAGAFKLKNGTPVTLQDEKTIQPQTEPSPKDS